MRQLAASYRLSAIEGVGDARRERPRRSPSRAQIPPPLADTETGPE